MSDQRIVLSVEQVRKTYGETVAVDDVSFQVAAGEVVGLLGPNGAGKTTTINMICNLPGIDDEPFPDLEMVLYGASPIAPAVLSRAIEVFDCRFFQFFGMTETSGCTILLPEHHDPIGRPDLLASAGVDASGFETRIVDPDDQELPPGEVGEIVCRGPHLMAGYWNRPDATAEALRNGWMHTGDAGYRTAEGFVFVTDRIKDMIVTGGENVYPREVEDALSAHPAVLEAAVVGRPERGKA